MIDNLFLLAIGAVGWGLSLNCVLWNSGTVPGFRGSRYCET